MYGLLMSAGVRRFRGRLLLSWLLAIRTDMAVGTSLYAVDCPLRCRLRREDRHGALTSRRWSLSNGHMHTLTITRLRSRIGAK
jgi:hypothetical protein